MAEVKHNNECFQLGYFTWHHAPERCGCPCHAAKTDVSEEGADRG